VTTGHYGCIPLGQSGDDGGFYGGRFCPRCGSVYNISARIRSGSAPLNLAVPPYAFTGNATV
jgi:ubiquinol-cytochrome c reductase iron-sulfur subunit